MSNNGRHSAVHYDDDDCYQVLRRAQFHTKRPYKIKNNMTAIDIAYKYIRTVPIISLRTGISK